MLCNLIAPLMCGGILAVIFLYFIFNNLIAWSADLGVPMNATASLALTFAVPFLTMRMFAEERAKKTEQLYLTAAVSPVQIVLGKFLAVAALLAFPTFIACLLPLILRPYGEVQYLTSYTAILCFFLYALMVTAIGMFVSSLTQNVFGAGIVTFLLLLLGVMMSSAYDSISVTWLADLLRGCFDFGTKIARMMGGLFDLTSVIFFVSVCAFFLFLTIQGFYLRRYDAQGEGKKTHRLLLLCCLLAFVLTVCVNLIAARLPASVRTWDVTSNGLYSITEESKAVVRGLQEEYRFYYLADEADRAKDENIERILQAYARENERITLEYINPVLQPQFYAVYSDTELSADSVVIVNETTGRSFAMEYRDLVETQLNMSSFTEYVTGYDAEGQITNALQRLSVPAAEQRKAYCLTGHGEALFDSLFEERFRRAGLAAAELNLMQNEGVAADCGLLVINAPVTDLSETETQKVLSYLEAGGNLLLITDARNTNAMPQLSRILAFYGVTAEEGLVVETDPEGYLYDATGANPLYILPLMVSDDITESILNARNGTVFCPLAGAFSYAEDSGELWQTPLLVTSEAAYLADPAQIAQSVPEALGRFVIGLKSVKALSGDRQSVAVFYASAQMFTAEADTQIALGRNSMLFGNSLNALLPEDMRTVTIPVKSFYNTLSMSANAAKAYMIILGLFVPFLWVMGGVLWWLRRRL